MQKNKSILRLSQALFAILALTTQTFALEFIEVDGDRFCPAGHRLMSYSVALKHKQTICNSLQDWLVARLAGDGSFSGAGNNCEIYKIDHRPLGASLCISIDEDLTPIRGILLLGRLRTQDELNAMSANDQRDALIVELANRTAGLFNDYDALDNSALAGFGELYLLLVATGRLAPNEIANLDLDDMRQTLIFELNKQTGIPVGELNQLTEAELVALVKSG